MHAGKCTILCGLVTYSQNKTDIIPCCACMQAYMSWQQCSGVLIRLQLGICIIPNGFLRRAMMQMQLLRLSSQLVS